MTSDIITQIVLEVLYKDKASRPAQETEQKLRQVFGNIKNFMKISFGTYTLKQVTDFIVETARLAGENKALESSFHELAEAQGENANVMLSKMKEAVRETVDNMELMKAANQAMLLQLPATAEDMAFLAEAGYKLGKAVGKDATYGLQSLIEGLGKGSREMLDNLGIVIDTNAAYEEYAQKIGKTVDELTEAERKTAFYEAGIKQVKASLEKMGEVQEDVTDQMLQAQTAITEAKIALGELFAPAVAAVSREVANSAKTLKSWFDLQKNQIDLTSEKWQKLEKETKIALLKQRIAILEEAIARTSDPSFLEMLKNAFIELVSGSSPVPLGLEHLTTKLINLQDELNKLQQELKSLRKEGGDTAESFEELNNKLEFKIRYPKKDLEHELKHLEILKLKAQYSEEYKNEYINAIRTIMMALAKQGGTETELYWQLKNTLKDLTESTENYAERTVDAFGLIISSINAIGYELGQALAGVEEGWKNVLKRMLFIVIDAIEQLVLLAKIKRAVEDIGLGQGGIFNPANWAKFAANNAFLLAQLAALEVARGAVAAMAKGGIVTSPTLSLIGEAGPEAVIPLSKLPEVTNVVKTDEVVREISLLRMDIREMNQNLQKMKIVMRINDKDIYGAWQNEQNRMNRMSL